MAEFTTNGGDGNDNGSMGHGFVDTCKGDDDDEVQSAEDDTDIYDDDDLSTNSPTDPASR